MSLRISCRGCRFWEISENQPVPSIVVGECHRYPPKLFSIVFTDPGELGDEPYITTDLRKELPETYSDDWCGEAKPHE